MLRNTDAANLQTIHPTRRLEPHKYPTRHLPSRRNARSRLRRLQPIPSKRPSDSKIMVIPFYESRSLRRPSRTRFHRTANQIPPTMGKRLLHGIPPQPGSPLHPAEHRKYRHRNDAEFHLKTISPLTIPTPPLFLPTKPFSFLFLSRSPTTTTKWHISHTNYSERARTCRTAHHLHHAQTTWSW